MTIPNSVKCFFPILMLIVASFACVVQQDLGEAIADCETMPFTLLGEVDHKWQANVNIGVEYEVTLSNVETDHPLTQIAINVVDEQTDIAGELLVEDTTVKTRFTSNNNKVSILIYSKIGENQQDLGSLTLQIQPISQDDCSQ